MKSDRKKILYVITKSNFGGAQRYVFELATSLPRDQYEVTVAFGGEGLLKEKLEAAGIRTHVIKNFERDITLIKEFGAALELARLIRTVDPDVVHLNSSKAGGTGAFIAWIFGVPKIIFTAHGWPFFEKRNIVWRTVVWFLSWLTALFVHTVIVVSEHDYAHMRMPGIRRKSVLIHTAIPPIPFLARDEARSLWTEEERDTHLHDIWLCTVAELTKNKNLAAAISAVALYNARHERKIYYTIFGDGELRDALQETINEEDLHGRVKLAGYVKESRNYLKAFDAFLLPSKKEGMPYALIEAGAAGLPAAASNVGGMPEIIKDGVSGILFDPLHPEHIAAGIERLLSSKDTGWGLGETLRTNIMARFGLTEMLQKTMALYEKP